MQIYKTLQSFHRRDYKKYFLKSVLSEIKDKKRLVNSLSFSLKNGINRVIFI